MKKKYLFIVLLSFFAVNMIAQTITFGDKQFETGVKEQLGLDSADIVTRDMAESISVLDLEGYGIENVRDIVYFPNLEELNISCNAIRDISPLQVLGRLSYLNIQNNLLATVDMLAFTRSPQMTVNLSSNYITDFYAIQNSPQCLFTIIGTNLQYPHRYEVNKLYADYDLASMNGIVNSNFWLLFSLDSCTVKNGEQNFAVLPDSIQQILMNVYDAKVLLMLGGTAIDSTYFIPPSTIKMASDSIAFVPSFPEDYEILSAESFNSVAGFSNDSVFFKLKDSLEQDTLKVGYGTSFGKLKGYTYYFMNKSATGVHPVVPDKLGITISPNPAKNMFTMQIKHYDNEKLQVYIYDTQGKKMEERTVTSNISTFNIATYPQGVYFVTVYDKNNIISNQKLIIKK